MTHVILDPHDHLAIAAHPDGDGCAVSAAPGDAGAARPAIVVIDDACRVTLDPAVPSAAAALPARPPPIKRPDAARPRRRFGCSATDGTAGAPIALAALSLLAIRARSRRRRARAGW
jgi:MYXO-CTERM domain-containing protein